MVGLGTKWNEADLTDKFVDTNNGVYTGTNALAAWEAMGCDGDLPLDGERLHWQEDCLNREFMTPRFRNKQGGIVSSITLNALVDLGYSVDFSEEETFGLDDLGDCGDFCSAATRRRNY